MESPYLIQRRQRMLGLCAPEPAKAIKLIANKSVKAKSTHKEYKKIVKEMLAENNLCEIKEDGCTKFAEGLHHKKKRGQYTLLEKDNLMRACNNCNLWIEVHPLESIEKGYSISKHKVSIALAQYEPELKATIIK